MTAAPHAASIGALADVVMEADPVRTARVMDQLAGLSGPGWLRLDELARRPYWGQSPLDAVADWRPLLTAGGALAGIAASMCRDGRVREAAVTLLAGLHAPVAVAALAVRVADWVPEVSSAAWAAVSARTRPEDAAAIIPVFLALRQRRRGRQAAARYLESIAEGPVATLEALAAARDRACTLWALQAQADRDLFTAEVLAARAMRDPDPVVALWCARSLADPSGELQARAGLRLLGSARAGVRAFAAGHLRDDQLTRQALQELLLDRSGAVRSMARWRWRRQWGDPGPVYRSVLAGPSLPREIAAALQGLDEDHAHCLPGAAVPFLAHQSPRVRRAAAQAVGRHASTDGILEHLVPLLLDSAGKVAAAALRHVRGHAQPASVLASLDTAGTPRSRRVALSIRQHSGTWDRIHADRHQRPGSRSRGGRPHGPAGLAAAWGRDQLRQAQRQPGRWNRRTARHPRAQRPATPGDSLRDRHPQAHRRIAARLMPGTQPYPPRQPARDGSITEVFPSMMISRDQPPGPRSSIVSGG